MDIGYFVWLIAIPLAASPLIYLSGHIKIGRGKTTTLPQYVALAALLLTWVPFYYTARDLGESTREVFTLGGITLCLDGIGMLLAAIALGLGTLVVLFSGMYMSRNAGQEKYYAMLSAMIGVMIGLGFTCDLFNLWIWFEAMAVSSYLLVAFYYEQPASLEAGIKYLVQSAVGSVLVLLGIGLVFSQAGTLNIQEIRAGSTPSTTLLAAGALFIIGFGVKTALVPLHTWLPDAHSQAPSGISAMLSGVVIEAGLIAMLRSLSAISQVSELWGPLLIGFGTLNMLAGNLLALRQVSVKRLLAFSSLVHTGYMLVGLGIAIYVGQSGGAQGGFFHLFNHGVMKGLAFLAAGSLLYTLHISTGSHSPLVIQDLSGAARRYPLIALTFSLAVFGLGGIPPLAGFMSKWQIMEAGIDTRNLVLTVLVVFTALNSVFSLAYYAPMVNTMYRQKSSPAVDAGAKLSAGMALPLILMAIVILVLGIWPSLLNWLTEPAALDLMAAFQ